MVGVDMNDELAKELIDAINAKDVEMMLLKYEEAEATIKLQDKACVNYGFASTREYFELLTACVKY